MAALTDNTIPTLLCPPIVFVANRVNVLHEMITLTGAGIRSKMKGVASAPTFMGALAPYRSSGGVTAKKAKINNNINNSIVLLLLYPTSINLMPHRTPYACAR